MGLLSPPERDNSPMGFTLDGEPFEFTSEGFVARAFPDPPAGVPAQDCGRPDHTAVRCGLQIPRS